MFNMITTISIVLLALVWAQGIHAQAQGQRKFWYKYLDIPTGVKDDKYSGSANFTQYIDHKNPQLGTFKQFYYYSTKYWRGPGSPIVVTTPGEGPLDSDLGFDSSEVMPGAIAKAIGAAVVIIEHRFYGSSTPVKNLSTANLQHLNLKQVIADFTRFANHPTLPFDHKDKISSASKVPWVYTGCSYAGALAGWIASVSPGTYWAYQGSSAVVEAVYDFWTYFVPIEKGMPATCLEATRLVIKHIDDVLEHGSPQQKRELKAKFKLQSLDGDGDFASAVVEPLYRAQYFPLVGGKRSFCSMVQGSSTNAHTKASLKEALDGYAEYFVRVSLEGYCSSYGYRSFNGKFNVECFRSTNGSNPIYTDISIYNLQNRQWMWMLCNQPFSYWTTHAPGKRPSIVAKPVTAAYFQRQCGFYFPPGPKGETYGSNGTSSVARTNLLTHGWDFVHSKRLVWGNNELDPYREATVSADFRPGGPLKHTPEHPVYVVKNSRHCGDWSKNTNSKDSFEAQVAHIKEWVRQWPRK